jgi:hypothetical protein
MSNSVDDILGSPEDDSIDWNPTHWTKTNNPLANTIGTPGTRTDALARGAVQGATLGMGNKAQALLTPGDYTTLRDQGDAANAAALKAHPGYYLGGQIVGGAPAAMATRGNIAPLAAQGAIQGAGRTANDNWGVVQNAATGAGINTALGVGGKAVSGAADYLGNKAMPGIMKEVSTTENLYPGTTTEYTPPEAMVRQVMARPDVGLAPAKRTLSDAATNAYNFGKASVVPLAGTAAGTYLGGKAAPYVGIDKSTGQMLGGELGGGVGLMGANKQALLQAIPGIGEAVGRSVLAYPNVVPRAIGVAAGTTGSGLNEATMNVTNQPTPMEHNTVDDILSPTNSVDEALGPQMDNRSRLQRLADDFQTKYNQPENFDPLNNLVP